MCFQPKHSLLFTERVMDPHVVTEAPRRNAEPHGQPSGTGIFIHNKCPQLLGILLSEWDNLCLCTLSTRSHKSGIPKPTSLPPTSLFQHTLCDLYSLYFARYLRNISLKGTKGGWREGWTEEPFVLSLTRRTAQDFSWCTQSRKRSYSSAGNGIPQFGGGEKRPPKGSHPESVQMKYELQGTPIPASSPGPFVQIIISIYALFVSLPLVRIQKLNLSAFSMRFSFL